MYELLSLKVRYAFQLVQEQPPTPIYLKNLKLSSIIQQRKIFFLSMHRQERVMGLSIHPNPSEGGKECLHYGFLLATL
jgi:hypothetical protein